MSDIQQLESVDVLRRLGRSLQCALWVALERKGKRPLGSAMPNDEAKLRELMGQLKAHGQILLVVDQPATIGALPVAVAQAEGALIAYLPGLAMMLDLLQR